MEAPQDQQIRSHQRATERQLAATLYQLGRGLAEDAEPDRVLQLLCRWKSARDEFIQIPALQWLRQRLDLDPLDLKLITIGHITRLEPETLSPYLRLSWYEQPPGLSLERALFLSDVQDDDKPDTLHHLRQYSPACRYRLLEPHNPTLTQPLLLAEDLSHTITAGPQTPDHWAPGNLLSTHPTNATDPVLTASYPDLLQTPPQHINILRGQTLAERTAIVAQLAAQHQIPHWYLIDTSHHTELSNDTSYRMLRNIYLHSDPGPCYLYWPELYQYCWQHKNGIRTYQHLCQLPHLILFTDDPTETHVDEDQAIPAHYLTRLQHSTPEKKQTDYTLDWPAPNHIAASWQIVSDQITRAHPQISPLTPDDSQRLTTLYRLLPTQIRAIADQLTQNPPIPSNNLLNQLQQIARTTITSIDPNLASLGQKDYHLSNLILATDTRQQLQELIDRVTYAGHLKNLVLNVQTGAQALFWGKPGTGKTMAAHAIASELQLPLYQINLANIASKWIGETEKHLAKLFDTAEQQQAILLFDEADAIFAKRSEVESSHDKNANMGVSFLLQRMENYTGLLLLSTNFKSNLDQAFLRRFHAAIEFRMPDASLRRILWHKVWPDNTFDIPTEQQLNLLADNFEFSPSQIRNIAERTILFAIRDHTTQITEQQLRPAIARELQKEDAGFLAEQKITDYFNQAASTTNTTRP
ncbi:MAG: AAA family ATPase [Pseudomonadota bacterium]